jgi:hypothetical protein
MMRRQLVQQINSEGAIRHGMKTERHSPYIPYANAKSRNDSLWCLTVLRWVYDFQTDEVTRYVYSGGTCSKDSQRSVCRGRRRAERNQACRHYSVSTVGYRYVTMTSNLLREATPDAKVTRFVYNTRGIWIRMIEWVAYNSSYDGLNEPRLSTPTLIPGCYRYLLSMTITSAHHRPRRECDALSLRHIRQFNQQINTSQYDSNDDGFEWVHS